ncbi:hypothetical protein VTK56DRAFT_3834 [Thermocarpiscus australiensis]
MTWPRRLFLASFLSALCRVRAEDVRISSIPEPPVWLLGSLMHLRLTAPETDALRLTYSVYPLTVPAGLNQTDGDRNDIWIRGSLVPAENPANALRLRNSETIAFLSCDPENSTAVVNMLMADRPKAILLYSVDGNCCRLEGSDMSYTSIFTMADSTEARHTMNNTMRAGGVLRAAITGNTNATITPPGGQEQSGNNSAVAMSILYSITGLITLLFLVIIATGAIRAHRYPERYGPRSGYGGRPRQSRARGLARAVLETLPIVKFGDPGSAKPDPGLELESQASRMSPDPAMGTRLSAIPEEPQPHQQARQQSDAAPMSGAVSPPEPTPAASQADAQGTSNGDKGEECKTAGHALEEHLGCSICTEDFTVGEDVRVLPCDHKFHPACIDPWLINVSGTCPLCRLDLRPRDEQIGQTGVDPSNPLQLAPPLSAEWNDHDEGGGGRGGGQSITAQRRRSSRLLDLHRLRHATVEERIEILRRHRSQQQQQQQQRSSGQRPAEEGTAAPPGESEEQQRGRAARLAERLRDTFRIRTRAQSPVRSTGAAAGGGARDAGGPPT